jgi:hypothetical protein
VRREGESLHEPVGVSITPGLDPALRKECSLQSRARRARVQALISAAR